MEPTECIAGIKHRGWYRGQIAHTAVIPATPPAPVRMEVHPCIQRYLDAREIVLYRHQAEAIAALRAGNDVIITTPTASGKTLAFNIPIFERLIADEAATALYIYPLKALANDQLDKLRVLERACGLTLHPATYDGDTPAGARGRIKARARIILTNPHALHYYLPWHHQWARFFRNLRFIVIDEAHTYRGVFGANVALLLRRLYRILGHYGANPQIVLSSASIANPADYARALTGRDAVAITESGAGHGARTAVFWDGLTDPDTPISLQAARILVHLTDAKVQTICFTRSRAQAELIARRAGELGGTGILPYRAGYLPHERREIERGLRTGDITGVVSTSALEAGIDIGGLDAAILVG
ncbi:MAG: DEAD/DEAH box helicase, partial [Nitrospiraceae bacterium]|nr:DEAD/DEAH box helicase [Nitrospiraceae bacterium]